MYVTRDEGSIKEREKYPVVRQVRLKIGIFKIIL